MPLLQINEFNEKSESLFFSRELINNPVIQKSIVLKANQILNQLPISVIQKTILIEGNKDIHNYQSIMPYVWPNKAEFEKNYIYFDGKINYDNLKPEINDEIRLKKLAETIELLSLAYRITHQEKYCAKAKEFLTVWFLNPETNMNPNFNHAQSFPGKNSGSNWGLIEARYFVKIVMALEILKSSSLFTKEFQVEIEDWFRLFLDWLIFSGFGSTEKNAKNNHSVWYNAEVVAIAYFLKDFNLAKKVLTETLEQRISLQIDAEGKMSEELKRTRPEHYTEFNLKAFITLAYFGDLLGVNLWDYTGPQGQSIKKALDFYLNYCYEINPEKDQSFINYLFLAKDHFTEEKYNNIAQNMLRIMNFKNKIF